MADLSVNKVGASTGADAIQKNEEVKEEKAKEVQDEGLLTSEAIENSKVEEDVLVTNSSDEMEYEEEKKEEEPQVNLSEELSALVLDTTSDVLSVAAIQEDNTTMSTAEYVLQKKEEQAEKEAQEQNEIKKKAGSNIKVKLVKKNGKWEAVKPDTPEFHERDKFMQNVKQEYAKNFPEPSFSTEGVDGSESAEHAKWKSEYNKHMTAQEKAYQEQNEEYMEQYKAYKKAQRKAKSMN